MNWTLEAIQALDRADTLSDMRAGFVLAEDVIYLDGNSLGAMPSAVSASMQDVVQKQWASGLVRSWNDAGWITLPARVAAQIAPLLGADPRRVFVGDSTSVNLYKLLHMALDMRPDRRRILSESGNFPTDLYVAEGIATARGHEFRRADFADVANQLDDRVAVLLLSHVNYRSGAMHAMREITRRAHQCGTLVIWDLAHSAGAVPLALDDDQVDFAVGCGYKFLNGGPGAPAFAYAHPRIGESLQSPIRGWFGHARPFDFDGSYEAASGVQALAVGTPAILSMTALHAALAAFAAVDMDMLRHKSLRMFEVLAALCDEQLAGHGFELVTPRSAKQRGSQLSLSHPDAWPICRALIANGVIGDFRAPDILRFGLTPLYTRFDDLWTAVQRLRRIMDSGIWKRPEYQLPSSVT